VKLLEVMSVAVKVPMRLPAGTFSETELGERARSVGPAAPTVTEVE
jgi:hypothetical protein